MRSTKPGANRALQGASLLDAHEPQGSACTRALLEGERERDREVKGGMSNHVHPMSAGNKTRLSVPDSIGSARHLIAWIAEQRDRAGVERSRTQGAQIQFGGNGYRAVEKPPFLLGLALSRSAQRRWRLKGAQSQVSTTVCLRKRDAITGSDTTSGASSSREDCDDGDRTNGSPAIGWSR